MKEATKYVEIQAAAERKPKRWAVVHLPTNCRIGTHRLKTTAKEVLRECLARFPEEVLAINAPEAATQAMRAAQPDFCRWVGRTDSYPTLDRFLAAEAAAREAAEALARAKAEWEGQTFYYNALSQQYCQQGEIAQVLELCDGDPVCVVAWSSSRTSFGRRLHRSLIERGVAPDELPWVKSSSGEWRARVAGRCVVVGQLSQTRFGVWTGDISPGAYRLPEATCKFEHPTLEAAQAAAEAWAREHTR